MEVSNKHINEPKHSKIFRIRVRAAERESQQQRVAQHDAGGPNPPGFAPADYFCGAHVLRAP